MIPLTRFISSGSRICGPYTKKIVVGQETHRIKIERAGRGLDARARAGRAARRMGGNSSVGELRRLRSGYPCGCDAVLLANPIEQQPRPRFRRVSDETDGRLQQPLELRDHERIAAFGELRRVRVVRAVGGVLRRGSGVVPRVNPLAIRDGSALANRLRRRPGVGRRRCGGCGEHRH